MKRSNFDSISTRTRYTRAASILAWTVAVILGSISLPADAVELVFSHDGSQAEELPVGSDLAIGFVDGIPYKEYAVELVDEDNEILATAALVADDQGAAEPELLWTRTGIVGCDYCVVHDPDTYRFASYEEALDVLDGRTFQVILRLGGNDEANEDFSFVPDPSMVKFFIADSTGCFRTILYEEDLYLSVRHEYSSSQTYRVFVVHAQEVWEQGDPLVDVRPGGSHLITVAPGTTPTVQLLWIDPEQGQQQAPNDVFQIILRTNPGTGQSPPVFDPGGDITARPARVPSGGTADECIICIPPTPQVP